MGILVSLGFLVLGVLSVRGVRWAYITFVVLGLLYFPATVGFRLEPQPCQVTFDRALAIHSLTNYGHIVRFALFFVMTNAQLNMSRLSPRSPWSRFVWAASGCLSMGVLVELAEGVTGNGHCRSRDLIPDAVGILLGWVLVWLWNKGRTKRTNPLNA